MKPAVHRSCRLAGALLAGVLAALRAEDRKPAPAAPPPAESTIAAPPSAAAPAGAPPATGPAAGVTPAAGVNPADKITAAKKRAVEAAARVNAPVPLSPRFQQVRDRIQVLYGNRDGPPPPIDARHNPFRSQPLAAEPAPAAPAAAAPAAAPGASAPEPAPPAVNPSIALVKQAAALLKVTGFVERDGRTLLNINQALYREGDTIKVAVKGQSVLLRIKKLTRTSLTVVLNDAETTLTF